MIENTDRTGGGEDRTQGRATVKNRHRLGQLSASRVRYAGSTTTGVSTSGSAASRGGRLRVRVPPQIVV